MASFWLAYKVQSRDAYYKELTIKPVLVTHVDNDFTYTLRNNGLGPAVITDWTLTFEGVSYKIETMNAENMGRYLRDRLRKRSDLMPDPAPHVKNTATGPFQSDRSFSLGGQPHRPAKSE